MFHSTAEYCRYGIVPRECSKSTETPSLKTIFIFLMLEILSKGLSVRITRSVSLPFSTVPSLSRTPNISAPLRVAAIRVCISLTSFSDRLRIRSYHELHSGIGRLFESLPLMHGVFGSSFVRVGRSIANLYDKLIVEITQLFQPHLYLFDILFAQITVDGRIVKRPFLNHESNCLIRQFIPMFNTNRHLLQQLCSFRFRGNEQEHEYQSCERFQL